MKISLLFLVVIFASCAFGNALLNVTETNNHIRKMPKKSYVCPPNFMRLSHRCYYFSREPATWQDAYFKCRDLHSNLAIVKNANQDKLIRKTLSKRTLAPLERWLGGLYDWEQMTWKWAASGKIVTYNGFSQMDNSDKEKLRWHCIILDPAMQFKWNSRSCLEEKHFICHTKIKIVTGKGKKKLLKQYNVNKTNKLNEIPVPNLPEYNSLKDVNLQSEYALRPKVKKRKTNKKPKSDNNMQERVRRQKNKDDNNPNKESIKWKTYYKNFTRSPLHPKAIVEEFNYVKEG